MVSRTYLYCLSGDGEGRIVTEIDIITYRHVASVAGHIAVLGVGSNETTRAGLVLPQTHLAARHPASFRPSLVPPG